MTKSKKLRVLREIYASAPDVECRGLCAASCTTIPVFPIELAQLEAHVGRTLPTTPVPGGDADHVGRAVLLGTGVGEPCPLLVMGRCTAYEARPLICRAFGGVEGMRCPHGCAPVQIVSDDEQLRKFQRLDEL